MKILMLGSDEIRLNEYRYDICRSLLFGDDIEVETTREGAVRNFIGSHRPDLVILDANTRSASVMHFLEWLKNLPFRKTLGLKVVILKKGNTPSRAEMEVEELPLFKGSISHPLNVRELKSLTYNFQLN
ncbi:MAG: hypothetical protein IT233_04475 [Bacteroidia bacterium]|nr:hypothetical protein [Bacteroidia bacterium]